MFPLLINNTFKRLQVMKANWFVFLTLFLSASMSAQSAVASSDWPGKWDSSPKPVENPVVYYYYELTKASEGFNWKSVKRDVPYGPNEIVRAGRADFVSRSQAVDYVNKLTFDLSVGASGERRLTVRSQGVDDEVFYFVPVFFKAGFDCRKASTAIEKSICTDKRVAMADLEINQQYKKARMKLAGIERKVLKTSQRSWIKQRNQCLVTDKVDMSCLALSYANRLATLQKINNPVLGRDEGVNSSYLAGLEKTRAVINKNVPILLVVAGEQPDWAVDLMKRSAAYKVINKADKTTLLITYAYASVCWPSDCMEHVELVVSVDSSGNLKVVKKQVSEKI